jgi:hypothetical protein
MYALLDALPSHISPYYSELGFRTRGVMSDTSVDMAACARMLGLETMSSRW